MTRKIDFEKYVAPYSEDVSKVLSEYFQIDEKTTVASIEILRRDSNPTEYDRLRFLFERRIRESLDGTLVRKRKYFGPQFAVFLDATFPKAEISDLRPDLVRHYPVCTLDEIRRIELPTTAADYLLTVRASEISENARLHRVFLKRRERAGNAWTLSSHFDNSPFEKYLACLPAKKRLICKEVEAGFAFLLEPNGVCVRSPFGHVIIISETLKEYLYFMNLFLMCYATEKIPKEDCVHSLFIALRTMLFTESPDFELDPRGTPPEPLDSHCKALVDEQMQFVIGHEYSHYLLGHLGQKAQLVSYVGVLPGADALDSRIYTPKQAQEFAADLGALSDPELSPQQLATRLNAANWLFLGLEVLDAAVGYISPPMHPRTHPTGRDRLLRLRQSVLDLIDLPLDQIGTDEDVDNNLDSVEGIKQKLCDDVLPFSIEQLEMYGSVYLPSYRLQVLADRVDY